MERIIEGAAPSEAVGDSGPSGQGAFASTAHRAAQGFCIEGVVMAVVAARAGGAHDGVIAWIAPQAEVFGRQERGADSCAPTRGEEIIASLVRWAVDLGVSVGVAAGARAVGARVVGAGVMDAAAAAAAGLQDMFPSFGATSAPKKGRASASQGLLKGVSQGVSQGAANDGQGSLFAPRVVGGAAGGAGDDTASDKISGGMDVAPEAIADVIEAQRAALTRRVMREGLAVFFPGLPPAAAPHPGDGVIVEATAPEVMERVLGAEPCASADLEFGPGYDPEKAVDPGRGLAGARSFCRAAPVAARFVFLARSAEEEGR